MTHQPTSSDHLGPAETERPVESGGSRPSAGNGGSRLTPTVIATAVLAIGAAQVLVFPISSTRLTGQVVVEVAVLFLLFVGLFIIPSSKELAGAVGGDSREVYQPMMLGLGFFALRALTDVLDEFLGQPGYIGTSLEDGSMIAGVVLFLVGFLNWSNIREARENVLREQRDRLEQQNERLETFASIVSHDLRNPIAVATGHLELVRESGELGHLDEVDDALERMETIVSDVLTLARLGSNAIETRPVFLQSIVEKAWETVGADEVVLDVRVDEDATVLADGSYLQRLFENLFRNSVEHTREPLVVRVGTVPEGFYVEDTGRGIPEDDRDVVFDTGYSTQGSGAGLGLHIVQNIATAHGWSVALSESPEGGARFVFSTEG